MKFPLEEMQAMSEKELEQLVLERAFLLEEQSQEQKNMIIPQERQYQYVSYYDDFIKKDVKIYSSKGCDMDGYYVLDSNDYLIDYFKYLQHEKVTNNNQAILRIASFLDMYFGVSDNDDDIREQYVLETGDHSLNSLKGKGIAACTERAALANNIIRMLGLRSIYVIGRAKVQTGDEVLEDDHGYNIVQNSRGDFILVDASINCPVYDEQNHLTPLSATYSIVINNDPITFLTEESKKTLPLEVHDAYAVKKENGDILLRQSRYIRHYGIEALPKEIIEEKSKTI